MRNFRLAHQWLAGYSAALEGRDPEPDFPDDEDFACEYAKGYAAGRKVRESL